MSGIKFEPNRDAILQTLASEMGKMTYGEMNELREQFAEGLKKAEMVKRGIVREIVEDYGKHPRRFTPEKKRALEMFKDAFPQSGFLSEIQLVLDSEWEKDARYAADADARVVVVQKMFKELRSMLDHSVAVQSKDWLVGDTEAHEKRCVKVGDLFFSAMLSAGSTWKDYTQNKIPFQRQERSWIKSVLDSNRTGLSWGEDPETGKTPNLSEAAFITSLQNAGEYDALTAKKVVAGIDAAYTEWLKNAEQKYSLEKSKALQERVQ